jgi:transitional endoplasmic reticulum ATPase
MRLAEELFLAPCREEPAVSAIRLTPSQQIACDAILQSLRPGAIFLLAGHPGMGKTTVLRHLRAATGGVLLGMRDFIDRLAVRRYNAIEQVFLEILEDALTLNDLVLVDDLHLLTAVTGRDAYPLGGLLDAAIEAMLASAVPAMKQLIFTFGTLEAAPDPIYRRAEHIQLSVFGPEGYKTICEAELGSRVALISFEDLYRFAPGLDGHDLKNACANLGGPGGLSLFDFRAYLESRQLVSNVDLAEVEPVDWADLKGMDDVIEALEAKIALPFENPALAADLKLKPKRGVLLSGPPGTGKTSIGRALAHRLKGKFFLIDGSANAEHWQFHVQGQRIFEQAKKNAPAVIFIDDADVIFESQNRGFYRYLLTLMDGIESTSAARVCVMITAMEPASVPQAMLRSGRIELWLETRLPDEAARLEILRERLAGLPEPFACVDLRAIAAAARHLTGADLKGVVEDAKLLLARDKARGRQPAPIETYFYESIETVRANHRRYRRTKSAKPAGEAPLGFAPV